MLSAGRYSACGWLVSAALLVFPGCSSSDSEEKPGEEAAGGFDEDVDPEELSAFEGKYDGDPCAEHPGGPLTGDDLFVIVNKEPQRQLQRESKPRDLMPIDSSYMMPGRQAVVRLVAREAFYELVSAAEQEAGLRLGCRSAFRSFETQCFTFNYKVETSGYDHAVRYSARPGRSEHQLGMAIDITSASIGWALTQSMGDTAEGRWLVDNAHRFGFGLSYPQGYEHRTGYGYEPWHWRYIGREAAQEMQQSGMTLIDYLFACEAGNSELRCPREQLPTVEPNAEFIGGACTEKVECESIGDGATCLTDADGYPGGQCTLPCTRSCPDRAGLNARTFCVADSADPTVGSCHSQCDTDLFPGSGCRDGYGCVTASRPNDAGDASVCLPR